MADIFDPTGQRLLDESIEKVYPNAPAVERPNPPILEGQGVIADLPPEVSPGNQPMVNEVSELERLNSQAQRATEEPAIRYRPLQAYTDLTPLYPSPSNEVDVEGLRQRAFNPPAQLPEDTRRAFANYSVSSGTVLDQGTLSQLTIPTPSQPWQTDYARIGDVWADRARREQARAIAQSTVPFAGVTRSLSEGLPFGNSSIQSAREFWERTTGASFDGIESEREETEPNNLFDRVVSGAAQVINPFSIATSIIENTPLRDIVPFRLPSFFTPDDVGTARRIAGAAGAEVLERSGERIGEVGLPRFIYENTFANITGENLIRNRAQAWARGQNPLRIFDAAPRTFQPTGASGIRANDTLGIDLDYYGSLSPDVGNSFFADLAERSPDFRNFIRDMSPAIDEAGRARFNPGAGYFGEFGSAGSLSALLYLANIPEGLITGALYDIADLTRTGVSMSPLAGLLSRVNPIYGTPATMEQAERIDTLGAFFGRDTGFLNDWSEENYLAFIGNPALDFIPQGFGIQSGLGFVADLITGGIADAGIDSVVRRAGIRTARELGEEVSAEAPFSGVRQLELDLGIPQQNQLELELNVPSRTTPSETPDIVSPGQLNLFNQPEAQQLNLELFPQRPLRTTQLELDLTVYPRQLEFDYSYSGPTSAARVVTGVQRNLPNGRSLYASVTRNPRVQRITNFFADILSNAENLNRRLDTPITESVQRYVNETLTAARRELGLEPGVVIRLADTNADVNTYISNGRRAVFSAKSADELTGLENARIRTLSDRVVELRRQIDSNEVLMAEAANRRSATPDDEAINLLEVDTLEEINERLRSTVSRIQNDIFRVNETSEAINEVNSELARLMGASPSGSVIRNIAEELPIEASTIRADDILPLQSRFPADTVLKSYISPLSMTDQFSFARRSNDELLSLSRFWGDAGTIVQETPNRTQLGDIYRVRYLQNLDPELYARAAKSLPRIDPQRNVVDIASVGDNRISMVAEVQDVEPSVPGVEPGIPLVAETRKLVEDEISLTSKYYEDVRKKLNAKLAKGQPTQNLPRQLEEAQALMNRIFADYPELAEERILRNLPEELRPAGAASERLAPEYAVAQQQTISTGRELQRMQIDLMELEDVVEQTQQQLSSLPQLQRINPADEFATRRMSGDSSVPTATSELAKPVAGVRINEEQLSVFSPDAALQPTPRQRARSSANAEGVSDPTVQRALNDIRGLNFAEGVEFEPDVRAIRQISSRVDSLTYRQAQAALKQYPGVRRVGNTEELKERLLYERIKDYRRAELTNDEQISNTILEGLGVNIRDPEPTPLVVYHGTKAENLDIPSTSLTNEYGIGLYTSTSSDVAWRYAKAQPAEDLVDLDLDFRTAFTNESRLFEIEASRAVTVDNLGQQNPLDFVVVNMNNPGVQDEYRQLIYELLQNYEPQYANRFRNWAKNKHPNQMLHYIRSQFLRDNRGQLPHFEFLELLNTSLRARDIDALKDGDNLVILTKNYEVGSVSVSNNGTNGLEEGLRNRIAVDQDLASRVPNKTTETILVQDDLALSTYAQNNLRNAVADQEREALDTVRSLNDIEQQLDNAVQADNVVNTQTRLDDIARDSSRQGSSSLRNDDVCL